jgi:hypothetical protein
METVGRCFLRDVLAIVIAYKPISNFHADLVHDSEACHRRMPPFYVSEAGLRLDERRMPYNSTIGQALDWLGFLSAREAP